MVDLETKTMKELYQHCFDRLHGHSYRFFSNSFTGALVKKVNKLVGSFESLTDMFIFNLQPVIVTVLITLGVIRWYHIRLGIAFTIRLIIYGVVQYVLYKRLLPADVIRHEQDSKVTAYLSDTLTNHYNITTFASLPFENKEFEKVVDTRRLLSKKVRLQKNIIYAFNGVLIIIFNFVLLYLIITLRSKGTFLVGTLVVLQMYIFRLFDQVFFVGNHIKRMFDAIAESAEMITIFDTSHEVQDDPDAKQLHITSGAIQIDNITFRYNSSTHLFTEFVLDISPGEKVALVGASGSGKSTIVKLLMRFFDVQQGAILIDGQDISHCTQDSLRSAISVVPQEPILFHRTIRENICYGNPEASMEEIIEAAKMARCDTFITNLPHGYDTLVGERGIKLSGGERQRVAIARAILENKRILILDEATSSLDSESEKLIQDAIHDLIQDKTALVIAHRLSTIKEMDRIVVMDGGQIVEQGTHQQLLEKLEGVYHKLRHIQTG